MRPIKILTLTLVFGLGLSAQAKSLFNLDCQDSAKNEPFQITVIDEEIHFCGNGESALITSDGEVESNLRTLELTHFNQINTSQYEVRFSSGLKNQPCPRCFGDVRHASTLILNCQLKISKTPLCIGKAHKMEPELGDRYNKVLRYGVGENHWNQVAWVTLYQPETQDFAIYVFDERWPIEKYTYGFYSGEVIKKDELTQDISEKLNLGYLVHPYSTNAAGLKKVKALTNLQFKY